MFRRIGMVVALAAVVVFGLPAMAGDETVTVEGKIQCAKCALKKADAADCQDVLVVEGKDGTREYYMVSNEVSEAFGHACQGKKPAVVTGTVQEKDGKMWLTATKIDAPGEGDAHGKKHGHG